MFDYGITLKLDDGLLGVKQLVLMLKVHLCMDHQSRGGAYTQSIIMQLLVVLYQKAQKLPQWEMLRTSLSMFNEEAGETTFSQLARAVVGDTQQRKFPHMDRLYKLLHIYGDVELDQLDDTTNPTKERTSRRKVDPDGEEVAAVVAFMKAKLRELKTESIMEYDGKAESYKSRAHASHNLKPLKARNGYWKDDMLDQLNFNIAKAKSKFYKTDWGGQYHAVWPECQIPEDELGPAGGVEGMPFSEEENDYQQHVDPDQEYNDEEQGEVGSDSQEEEKEHECNESRADCMDSVNVSAAATKNKEVWNSPNNSDGSDPDSASEEEEEEAIVDMTIKKIKIPASYCKVGQDNVTLESRAERRNNTQRKGDHFFPSVYDWGKKSPKKRKK